MLGIITTAVLLVAVIANSHCPDTIGRAHQRRALGMARRSAQADVLSSRSVKI
ncbi:MAG: hypothetical protein ACRDS1_06395 [Pseudonocardiaceae bacterium]